MMGASAWTHVLSDAAVETANAVVARDLDRARDGPSQRCNVKTTGVEARDRLAIVSLLALTALGQSCLGRYAWPTDAEHAARAVSLPWQLDDLPPDARAAELDSCLLFAEFLRAQSIEVPACWYTHGWIRSHLRALLAWWEVLSEPHEAVRWWMDLEQLVQSAMWRDALGHDGRHVDPLTHERATVPLFEEWLVAETNHPAARRPAESQAA
jgi:hypothetical protein